MTATEQPSPTRSRWPARLLAAITVGYAATLAWATHHPEPQRIVGRNPPSDKLMHVGAYAILGTLVATTLAVSGRLSPRRALLAAAALAAFGAIDEITQPLPWFQRTADPIDWLFDLAGIALGMTAVWSFATATRRLISR